MESMPRSFPPSDAFCAVQQKREQSALLGDRERQKDMDRRRRQTSGKHTFT